MARYARLRTDLVSSSTEVDGQQVYNIKDPVTGNYFRLREPEFWLIHQLDGRTSCEDIAAGFREKFNLSISADDVRQFVGALEANFFLDNSRSEQEISRKSYRPGERRSLFSRLLFARIWAFDPGRLLDKLTDIYRPFHKPFWMGLELLFILFGVSLLLANSFHFAVDLYEIFNIGSIVTIVLAFFILVTVHEFAHAVICRYYGGEVKELGFLLLYFQPCCYCNLSDAWLFEKKSHRLAVTLAGPYFELILLAATVVVWRVTVPGTAINELARILGIVIWVTLLLNLNPLIRLDGYYLLSDWLDIPNLRKKSFDYLSNLFKRRLLGWPVGVIDASPREKRIYLSYALLAVIYSAALVGYFLFVLAGFLVKKMGGAGLLLLVAVFFLTLRSDIVRFIKGTVTHLRYMKGVLKKPVRLISYLALVIVIVILFFVVRFPHRVTGEVTVRPIAEFSLLLNDIGMLEKELRRGGADSQNKLSYLQMTSTEMASLDLVPYVKDGQKVGVGDTLAVMISNQVTKEIDAETSVLLKLESDLALLRSPPKKEELDEAEAEVAAAQAVYDQKVKDEERVLRLADKLLIAREALETARSAMAIARAELENKKARLRLLKSPPKLEEEAVILSEIEKQNARLDFLKSQRDAQSIISPIAGTIVVSDRDKRILSVVDNSQVEVLISVSDFDIYLVRLNQEVKLKVRSFADRVFEGTVVHIPKGAVTSKGEAFFRVSTVIDNKDYLLNDGMTGYAKIHVGKRPLFSLLLRKIASIIRVEFWSWW